MSFLYRMRVRKKTWRSAGTIYLDDQVFEKDIPLYTAFELYIEQLKGNVYMYTHTHLNVCTCVYINVCTYTLCIHTLCMYTYTYILMHEKSVDL